METQQAKRHFWADSMRILAIFLVITIHASGYVLIAWSSVSQFAWFVANLVDSFARISVPLFVMLSGALLLDKKESTLQFISKRIPRLMLPWFFWGTVQLLYNASFSLNLLFAPGIKSRVIDTYLGGFWFMPMLLGLYLVTPLLKPFIQKAKNIDFYYVFLLWFIAVPFVTTLTTIFGFSLSLLIPVWLQYTGYFLAGYFLVHKCTFTKKTIKQLRFLFIVSTCIIMFGTYFFTVLEGTFTELFYSYTNIFVFTSSISGFIIFKDFFETINYSKKAKRFLLIVSSASLGIYLSHLMILQLLATKLFNNVIPPLLSMTLTLFLTFGISVTTVLILKKHLSKIVS